MADVDNLDINLGDYFKLCIIISKVGNLDASLGDYFMYFFYNGTEG